MAVLPDPPWPASEPGSSRRSLIPRTPQNTPEGDNNCQNVGNDVVTCYPTSTTKVYQNTSMHLVWNHKLPYFSQFDRVDIFLMHQDSLEQVVNMTNVLNPPGRASFPVNDAWWGQRGNSFNGTDMEYPMFFYVVTHNAPTSSAPPQATFTAIQTRLPDSVLAAQASSSAAAVASSSAVAASLSSVAATATGSGRPGGPSSTSGDGLQTNSGDGNFPPWAIALLVIFGTLAIVFVLLAIWLGLRRYRRRDRARNSPKNGSVRESMGSHTPMMAEVAPTGHGDEPGSPGGVSSSQGHQSFLPPGALGIAGALAGAGAGAAGSSRAASTHTKDTDAPFSGADAAIMAAAFRDTLRKPDFANQPLEEGESPDKEVDSEEEREAFLHQQLKEEGRDLRSVSSSRGVRVQEGGDGESMSTVHRHGGPGISRDFDAPSVDSG